jgi:hypothetical protein
MLPVDAHRRIAIAALGTQLLEGTDAFFRAGVAPLAKPPQRMAQTPVAGIIDIVGRQDMQAWGQRPDS